MPAYDGVIHVAGRPSWRLTHELDGEWPHVVLYVRDALGLAPGDAPAIPASAERINPRSQRAT